MKTCPKMPKQALKNDKLHNAEIKNRLETCRCNSELQRIEKEKRMELRMLKNEKVKFFKKFSMSKGAKKSNVSGAFLDNRGAFMSNNFKSTSIECCRTASDDYQNLHNLLFTKDEIDIEKMLCLYLLCMHDTQELTPPSRKKYKMTKENSPLERLIYRSRKKINGENLLIKLPLYIIEYPSMTNDTVLINDGRLASKVLFNEKLATILNTALKALYFANREKLEKIYEIANNEDELQKVLDRPKIQDYLLQLKKSPLVNSCDSFILRPYIKLKPTILKVVTKTQILENLLDNLHQNILQLPSRKKVDDDIEEDFFSHNDNLSDYNEVSRKYFDLHTGSSMNKIKTSRIQSFNRPMSRVTTDLDFKHSKNDYFKGSTSTLNKITIQKQLDDLKMYFPFESNIPEKTKPLNENIEKTFEEETAYINYFYPDSKTKPSDSDAVRYTLKQSTCEACMKKWMDPLPSPKTPRIKTNENPLTTNVTQRLSSLINKELHQQKSYDTRYSSEYGRLPRLTLKKDEKYDVSVNKESVHLNRMDLARIKQEIRDKETQKKLQKFLTEPI